jgi:PAS domain S-box-containing protein
MDPERGMNPLDHSSGTRPETPPVSELKLGHASHAASFLLARGLDARRESRRIAAGLIILSILSFALLNFLVYENAQNRLVKQHWSLLAVNTEARRAQVRDLLAQYESEARYVAGESRVRDWSTRAAAGSLTAAEQQAFDLALERAAGQFDLGIAEVVTQDMHVVARAKHSAVSAGGLESLVQRCTSTQAAVLGDLRLGPHGEPVMAVAVPIMVAPPYRAPVAVFGVGIERALSDRLLHWAGYGAAGGAYLVRRDGDRIVILSTPPDGVTLKPGERVASFEPRYRAAAMAAVGVESNIQVHDDHDRPLWATTRDLPEVGWGIVGEDDRSAVAEGMRGTLVGLLILDLAAFAVAVLALWFWRRQYRSGLAAREIEVTKRHAERVQSVFDTAFDAILTFDRGGVIRTVNRSAEHLFGHEYAEIEGQPIHRFLRGVKVEGTPAAQEGRAGVVTRSEGMRADGTLMPVEFSIGSAGQGEERLNTVIVRDITERVEAEKRIKSFAEGLEISNRRLEEVNAQLEEASRLKSEFLANTSHELRTPLNGMIGFLQLVLDGMCDSRDEERDFLKQALQCSRHLLGLINDVLDIAKIEAGKLTLEVTAIDIHQLFDEVYTVTHVQAAQKGLELIFDLPEDAMARARGDFGKVKQILINLVGNSLKFTSKGSIRIRAVAHSDLGHVMFEVSDTGIGIPADRQKLVFEKFTQGDGGTTRRYGGTGLGLAISRSLVELMGGIIGVQSEGEGRGTRMYFSLPVWSDAIEDAPAGDESSEDRIEGPPGGALVLVVEDDTIFRRFLTTLLHQHGYRTIEARHAEGGWMLARRLRPNVVVLDYALTCAEGANLRTGWDLAERITSDSATRHIPLIFVTGFDGELREKLRSTAFSRKPHHLMKPIDGGALVAKLEEVSGGKSDRVIRVLMADDDPSVTAFVSKVLPTSKYHVEIAGNGEECLHFLRTQPRGFDVLLLDLMMPQVSGYDVLREMTLTNTAPDLPVLVLTNFPEARNAEERRLLEEGLVLDVLPKTAVHDNPQLLPHVIDWQMQVAYFESQQTRDLPRQARDEPEEKAA